MASDAGDVDLGAVWYVIAEPQQDPARVVAGPIADHDDAVTRAHLEPFHASVMLGVWLVHNVRSNGYNVEWEEDAERPGALDDREEVADGD